MQRQLTCNRCGQEFYPPQLRGILSLPGQTLNPTCQSCRDKLLANSKWGVQARNTKSAGF